MIYQITYNKNLALVCLSSTILIYLNTVNYFSNFREIDYLFYCHLQIEGILFEIQNSISDDFWCLLPVYIIIIIQALSREVELWTLYDKPKESASK